MQLRQQKGQIQNAYLCEEKKKKSHKMLDWFITAFSFNGPGWILKVL